VERQRESLALPAPEQSRVTVPLPPQDKWEQLVAQDPRLEIVGPVSLMTLDTIMKCAFSHQGSAQTDGSVTHLQWQLLVLTSWGGPPWQALGTAGCFSAQKASFGREPPTTGKFQPRPNPDSVTHPDPRHRETPGHSGHW